MKPWLAEVEQRIVDGDESPDIWGILQDFTGKEEISDDEALTLAHLLTGSCVKCLNLDCLDMSDAALNSILHCLPDTEITEFRMGATDTALTPERMKSLTEILPQTKINILDIGANSFEDEGMEELAKVLPATKITSLDVSKNGITGKGLWFLADVLARTPISYLDVGGNPLTEEDAWMLLSVLPNTQVTDVVWPEGTVDTVTKAHMRRMCANNHARQERGELPPKPVEAAPDSQVTQADRIATIIDKQRRAALEDGQGIKMKPWLEQTKQRIAAGEKELDVETCRLAFGEDEKISVEEAKELAYLLKQSSITELDLRETGISDEGLAAIADELFDTNITTFVLDEGNTIRSAAGMSALAAGLAGSKIERLFLTHSGINDDLLELLAGWLPSTSVKELWLGENNITAHGLRPLLAALPNTRIQKLDLRHNELGNKDAKELLAVLPNTELTDVEWPKKYVNAEILEQIRTVCEENKERQANGLQPPPPIQAAQPQPQVTQTEHIATIIEKQRRAALEDGQGI